MFLRFCLLAAAVVAAPASAQQMLQPGQISGIDNPTPNPSAPRVDGELWGGDLKQIRELRIARMREIMAAHPEIAERWSAMKTRQERIAYIRKLDRMTPRQ